MSGPFGEMLKQVPFHEISPGPFLNYIEHKSQKILIVRTILRLTDAPPEYIILYYKFCYKHKIQNRGENSNVEDNFAADRYSSQSLFSNLAFVG